MKYIKIILIAIALAGCGQSTTAEVKNEDFGVVVGAFSVRGGGTMEVKKLTIDNTECIWVGRHTSSSLSCNWGNK